MNRLPGLLAVVVLAFALPSRAQEPATPAGETPTAADAPARGSGDAPSAGSTGAPATAGGKADERFKPSEKISEDLSVSFPADI
jgi:hypothetical protein